jgi:DNA-binding IclR family transcriptional regulator
MPQSVDRALTVLEFLADEPRNLGQVAEHVTVHKSTASRLLRVLETQAFVRRDAANLYRLGPRLFSLASRALSGLDIRALAAPHVRRLGELTGQTIHLASLEGDEVIYIDKRDSSQAVRMYSQIGRQAPLHCTGVGKVILAFRPEDERRARAERITYTRHTERTIVTPAALLAEFKRIRARGWAIDDREHEELIHCIAAPIIGPDGEVSAAISISAITVSLPLQQLLELAPLLLQTASEIDEESRLGHR